MSFKCFVDNCDWEFAENLGHLILSEHFITNHGAIRIVELTLDNLQINCHKMGEQEKELINVPYVIQRGGYNLLLCVSWGARFECWIYKLDDKPLVEDGQKLELTLTLNSVKKNVSDMEYAIDKELIFHTTTRPSEIISAQSGLSMSWKAMEKNYIETESSNPESSFITITIAFGFTIVEEEEKPEIEEVMENKENEVSQPALVLETQEICEEPSNSANLPPVPKVGKKKGEFKCPTCLTPLSVKMILEHALRNSDPILPDSPHSSLEGESSSATMQPEEQLCDNPQSVETVLESVLENSDLILPDSLRSSFEGESNSAEPIATVQPEEQSASDNPKKHQSKDKKTSWDYFTSDDWGVMNMLRNYSFVYENAEEKVPGYRHAKEEHQPKLRKLILMYLGYIPMEDSESDEE